MPRKPLNSWHKRSSGSRGKLDAINAQIFDAKNKAVDPGQQVPQQLKTQMDELTVMKTDLIQKLSVYSEEHPAVKALRKRISALEHEISKAPQTNSAAPQPEKDIDALEQQQTTVEKALDDESKKLTAARLGESLERNQQSEHLQVIEQPITPQKLELQKPDQSKVFRGFAWLGYWSRAGRCVLGRDDGQDNSRPCRIGANHR